MTHPAFIETAWTVPVLVEEFDPAQVIGHPGRLVDLAMSGARSIGHDKDDLTARVEVIDLDAGFRETFTHGSCDWLAWMVLGSAGQGLTADSGLLMLHDPRGAASMVPLPGLPWGRPMTFSLTPGKEVIHPGWLGYSVLPLSGSHTVKVARVEVIASHSPS
jgi:hypothetical protein